MSWPTLVKGRGLLGLVRNLGILGRLEKARRFFFLIWMSWMLPRRFEKLFHSEDLVALKSRASYQQLQLTLWYTLLGHSKQDCVVAMSIRTSVLFTGWRSCSTQYTPGAAG